MSGKANILFIMVDQINADCLSAVNSRHIVKTPNLDRLAASGVLFENAYCNNPICAPSRLSIVAGQYPHSTRLFGNRCFTLDDANGNTIGAHFRRAGYQTALIGKGHMIKKWDDEAYEHIRYCDLCDSLPDDPLSNHYFKFLAENGVADDYEDGGLPDGHECRSRGYATAKLPYKCSNEHWTGNEAAKFLENRDEERPFLLHLSFERPHPHWMPSPEHSSMYDYKDVKLGDDAGEWFSEKWRGKPVFLAEKAGETMRDMTEDDVRKALAAHYALITVIDEEIGKVMKVLEDNGDLENTVVVFTADHGEFAGDHGLIFKNIGIYESIQRVPFIISYPGCEKNKRNGSIIELVDVFPTLCELAGIELPEDIDGISIVPELKNKRRGKKYALCEWDYSSPQERVNSIRTERFRLTYYNYRHGGELYDHHNDPHELKNLWDEPEYKDVVFELMQKLFDEVNKYKRKTDIAADRIVAEKHKDKKAFKIHKFASTWSQVNKER